MKNDIYDLCVKSNLICNNLEICIAYKQKCNNKSDIVLFDNYYWCSVGLCENCNVYLKIRCRYIRSKLGWNKDVL